MLANLATEPFDSKDWIYEPKLDGIRALAYIEDGKVLLVSRNGLDLTLRYPGLVKSLARHKKPLILDGEIVALDKKGRPSFQLLQQRSGLSKFTDVKSAEQTVPIAYYVFDVLFADGKLLTALPVVERKAILEKVLKETNNVNFVSHTTGNGIKAFELCVRKGYEGVVAKRADSPYMLGKRSSNWLKLKATQSDEFVICGYSKGTGARGSTFGSLLLGSYRKGQLHYAGAVGTGFDETKLKDLMKRMRPIVRKTSPFKEKIPGKLNPTWVEPNIVVEIKFAEWTRDNKLRVPVFMRIRDDKAAKEVEHHTAVSVKDAPMRNVVKPKQSILKVSKLQQSVLSKLHSAGNNLTLEIEGEEISLTNLDKPFWPARGKILPVTKRDYLIYLTEIANFILPHLHNRALTLIRYPHGIGGAKFYQRHWEHKLPTFVETVRYYSDGAHSDKDFLLCNNLATLLWLAQIADLEIHTAHTRIDRSPDGRRLPLKTTGTVKNLQASILNYPDFMVFDLDPYLYSGKEAKGAEPELHRKGFKKACQVALWLKEILDSLSIKAFIKTSGKTGLHIYIPIVRNVDYDTVRDMAHTIGEHLQRKHAKDVTLEWAVIKRTGKIFFDYNMNARGKSLASIYSPRNSVEASVSVPITWDELGSVFPTDFTIRSTPVRLNEVGDLWVDILKKKNNLHRLLSLQSKKLA